MKKLLVICEPRYDHKENASVNLAMREIMKEYSNYLDRVHCFCPGDKNIESIQGSDGIIYHVTDRYNGNRVKKAMHQFKPDSLFLQRIINDNQINYVQIRIPSFFSLSFYKAVKKLPVTLTTYVAGDITQSLSLVFNKVPFIKTISKILDYQQYDLIKNSLVVTTGPVLKEKYSKLNSNIHSFFSTTHNDVIKRTEYKNQLSKIKIVYLGRVDPAKRLEDLLEACLLLKKNKHDFSIDIIGDGPHLSNIRLLAEEYSLKEYITFHGFVDNRNRIDEILLENDVIVLPSLTEGTPKVLPEAMSRGVIPIAVKDVGSNNYIIDHGVNGCLVNKNSPEVIANVLTKIKHNTEHRIELIKGAYRYAKERTAKNEIGKIWEFVFSNS